MAKGESELLRRLRLVGEVGRIEGIAMAKGKNELIKSAIWRLRLAEEVGKIEGISMAKGDNKLLKSARWRLRLAEEVEKTEGIAMAKGESELIKSAIWRMSLAEDSSMAKRRNEIMAKEKNELLKSVQVRMLLAEEVGKIEDIAMGKGESELIKSAQRRLRLAEEAGRVEDLAMAEGKDELLKSVQRRIFLAGKVGKVEDLSMAKVKKEILKMAQWRMRLAKEVGKTEDLEMCKGKKEIMAKGKSELLKSAQWRMQLVEEVEKIVTLGMAKAMNEPLKPARERVSFAEEVGKSKAKERENDIRELLELVQCRMRLAKEARNSGDLGMVKRNKALWRALIDEEIGQTETSGISKSMMTKILCRTHLAAELVRSSLGMEKRQNKQPALCRTRVEHKFGNVEDSRMAKAERKNRKKFVKSKAYSSLTKIDPELCYSFLSIFQSHNVFSICTIVEPLPWTIKPNVSRSAMPIFTEFVGFCCDCVLAATVAVSLKEAWSGTGSRSP